MADLQLVTKQIEQDEQGTVIVVEQRGGEMYRAADGTPSTITVLGSESKTYRARRDAFYRELAKQEGEHDPQYSRLCIAACAVSAWHGWEANGVDLPCTEANVRALLTVEHILAQVEQAAAKGSGFFGGGSPSSSDG